MQTDQAEEKVSRANCGGIFGTAVLTAHKDSLYREIRKLKEEVQEAETVKKCVEQTVQPTEQRKERSKGKDVSL